jgi:hypothetical protein
VSCGPPRSIVALLLDAFARVPPLRVQAHAREVARQGADVGGDRHAVVVEDDDDRRAQPAGLVDRLERDAAGHRAVADHGDDVAGVDVAAQLHSLLEPDGVADRRRRVTGAHDVVLGLGDRAERGQALVLADRRQLVATAGQHLVGIGLMAHVPHELVARRVQQRVQRHGELARAEVCAEVAADRPDRIDDVLADLLGDLGELLLTASVEVLRSVDRVQ